MSNPFKKQNNQKPQEMLLDRIIKQNAQNPGLQLNSILPTTSNNGNNGQRVNNGTNQIIQANRARTQQRSENVNIQQVGTLIKPSPEENKKQSTNLHANHFNPFATQRPYVTHQNRILAPSPPEASLLIKIVGKDGVALGSFRLDRSEVLQKKDVTIKEIKIEEAYKKQLTEMWNLIKQGKKALDVFILMTNLGILTSSQKNPHNPMPDNLIRRLKQGMQFYDFQPERESTMAKLLQQNIECNSNVALCQQIQKVRNMCKTDKFIGLYCILQNPTYLETKVDLPSFLMQDKIYLIRLYQYLSKSSRLSSRKLISLDEQLYILRQIVKYLIPLFPNEKSPPIDAHIELGRQVIRLLQIIFVDNSSEVTAQQVRNSFIPMLYDLKSIGIKNSTIKSFLNNFEFGLLLQWGNELEHMQLGCIQTFVQYYRSQKEMEGKMLTLTMMKLSQIAVYDEKMCEMVDRKQRKFVQTNKSVLQKRTNKSRMINIGIQCILLIKQSNKTNFKLYESQLIKLLYHVCPVSIMGFHSNSYTNLELVLPFISRYFKKSVNTQSQYVTIAQINQFLPQFYKFQSCSDNFTIAKYIMSLIKYLQANQFNTMIDPKCKLSEVEQVLKRLNISTLLSNTEISPLQLVRLLSKYIANYTQEYHYRGDSVRKSQKKQSKNKRKEQIGKLLNMLYQTMNNIIQYSVKQHEQNKNNSKQICLIGYGKILVNITLVANLIGCSGLLPNNQKNVIVQTSSNAVVGVHEADIPKHYHKIMQTLYKSYTTQQSSSKHRQIIQEHIRSGIKICREWQQNIKYKQKINNYLVYLLTAQYMYKISKETQLQPNLMFMNKYITYLNILQYVIQISNSCASFTPNYWYFVSTTLLLLPKMFSTHLYNHTAFDPSLAQLLLNNRQIIIALCLNRICAKQYAQANELYETISYLQLIRQLLCISQEQAELSNSRQSIMESRNKQDRVILDTIPNKMRKEIIEKGKILKRQNNQTILMSKILVVIAQIEIIYEGKIQELIQHQDYIDEVVSSILSLLVYYLNKVPSKNRHYLYDNESQQDICMWNIRCMNLFENIFHSPAGITIKIDKAHTLAQTCLKIIKSKAVKIRANGSEIISWIQILLPMIHKNIKSVKIYEVLLEQSILFLCQQKDQQQHRNYKMKQKRQHIKLVELIMVYLSNEHRISELFEEKCLLEKVLRSLMVILDNVFTLFMTQSSTYFKLSQLQTWYRTAVVSLVKISQFINIYYLMLTQKNERISDSLLAACTKTKLVLEQSSKNYPLLAMSAQKQQNIKQMILCCVSILSLGSENTNQYQRKIYFNQALINVSMGNKQSFKAFFLHLANQAIDNRTIYRQKHEQKSRVNKNYEQEVDANKYRSYYLLYYFINKILTSNDSHSRVYFMYQTQTNKIDNKLNQIMRDLLDHLIQPILIQDLNQNLWFLVLVHRMVKLDLGILQKGVCCQRILQFCCRTIDRLSLIKQSKANKRKSTRNYERFSLLKQNEEILYFEDWLVFVQVLGITCLVFRTSAHSSLPSNGNSLSFIRSFVFNKIKSFLMTWGNFELDVKKKLMLFPFSSFLNTNPSKQLVVKYLSQGLLEVQKQKKSDSKQLMGEQKEVTVQNYIKTTMMLSSIALILNLIKHDLLFLSGSQQGVKSKFMEFVQQVLASFGYFYDIYFQNASISLKNHQIISQNIDLHIKDPISTKNNCYLNKILREYWLIPAQGAGSQKLLRKQISRILDQKKQELSAILWYNNIDEALVSLGYKPSHKFITKSGINNGSMMLKSRMGNSLRFV